VGKTQNASLCFHCKNGHVTHTVPIFIVHSPTNALFIKLGKV